MSNELKELRIELGIIRSRLALANQKEREFYALFKDAANTRREIFNTHQELIIREAELLGKVQKVTTSKKVRVEKKLDVLKVALKTMTEEEKSQLVAVLLATAPM